MSVLILGVDKGMESSRLYGRIGERGSSVVQKNLQLKIQQNNRRRKRLCIEIKLKGKSGALAGATSNTYGTLVILNDVSGVG